MGRSREAAGTGKVKIFGSSAGLASEMAYTDIDGLGIPVPELWENRGHNYTDLPSSLHTV